MAHDEHFDATGRVLGYRDRWRAECAFRSMKSVLRIEPVHHRAERRIVAHAHLCRLAYLREPKRDHLVPSIDPLDEVAELCGTEGLWMHVDGAFGGLLQLSSALRPLVKGIERADSVAFDLHKWLHAPIEAGCVLVRHPDAHRGPFSPPAPYPRWFDRGVASGSDNYFRDGQARSFTFNVGSTRRTACNG